MYVIRIAIRWFFPSQNISSLLSRGEIPDSYWHIRQFQKTADNLGLPYVIVHLPGMQENGWGLLPDKLRKEGVIYLDLTSIGKEFSRKEYMASRFDAHASPAVHRRIGESLADYVCKQGVHLP